MHINSRIRGSDAVICMVQFDWVWNNSYRALASRIGNHVLDIGVRPYKRGAGKALGKDAKDRLNITNVRYP